MQELQRRLRCIAGGAKSGELRCATPQLLLFPSGQGRLLALTCTATLRGSTRCQTANPTCFPAPSCALQGSADSDWQQLWGSGGACTGMDPEDYFQLVADSFGAYDPAVGSLLQCRSSVIGSSMPS